MIKWQWKDSNEEGIRILNNYLRNTFKETLPNLSGKSFKYHFRIYINKFVAHEPKETLVEEAVRFKNYLIFKYQLT